MYKLLVLGFAIILNSPLYAMESYTEQDFKDDWSSPLYDNQAENILVWGSTLTLSLVLFREEFVDDIQADIAKDEPLGESAIIGDYMGQMIPNFAYMGLMYYNSKEVNDKSYRRAKLMFKTSLFSGMTTFFSKRLINQRRPNKGDRNSFPSGHTTTAFAFASVVALEHENWAIPAYALASFVGFSRMNDNAHYLHDVTMGATIGIAFGYALYNTQESKVSLIPYNDGFVSAYKYYF